MTTALHTAYLNGTLWTNDQRAPHATAFGIIGERIAAVGSDAEIRALADHTTQIVDLDGAFVMPGFIDNHTHFLRSSFMLSMPELRTATTRSEFTRRIANAAAALPTSTWLEGGNFDTEHWGGEVPTRDWIDAVTPNTPVAIVRLDQHMMLTNSLALQLAGVDRDTPEPEGGVIGRYANGEPNGIFTERAKVLIQRVIPARTDADIDAAMRRGIAYALTTGVTQVHLTEVDSVTHHSLRRMRRHGEPGIRFYSMVPIEEWAVIADLVAREGRGDDWVRWGGVKGLIDGSLGSRTALFREPYANDPTNVGVYRTAPEKLHAMIVDADAAELQVAIHAIGDEANTEVLDMFADVARKNGPRDRRFRIEHAQHLFANDISRFAQLGVIASMQPYHAIDDGRWAVGPLGERRLAGAWAIRSLLDARACVTFGSDWPVAPIQPLWGVDGAVTRRTIDGAHPDGWIPEEKISVEEALVAYTSSNAYAGYQEDRLGRLAPGFIADVVALDTDLLRVDPNRIKEAKVLRTIVGGVARFEESTVEATS